MECREARVCWLRHGSLVQLWGRSDPRYPKASEVLAAALYAYVRFGANHLDVRRLFYARVGSWPYGERSATVAKPNTV